MAVSVILDLEFEFCVGFKYVFYQNENLIDDLNR